MKLNLILIFSIVGLTSDVVFFSFQIYRCLFFLIIVVVLLVLTQQRIFFPREMEQTLFAVNVMT